MLPELAARAWGATIGHHDAMDTVVVRDGEDPWRFPEATEHALLHVCAYSFGGSARRTVAFARDDGWHAFDFDRESYVPLATFLHSADAYSLRSYETSRPEPGCVEW